MNPTLDEYTAGFYVSYLPRDHEDAHLFTVRVDYRGPNSFAITWLGECWSRAGEWDHEMLPSGRGEDWKQDHRFTWEESIPLARKLARGLVVNRSTVDSVLTSTSQDNNSQAESS